METTTVNLRQRAIQAYKEAEERRAEAAEEQARLHREWQETALRDLLRDLLGVELAPQAIVTVRVSPSYGEPYDTPVAFLEGLRVSVTGNYYDDLALVRECPKCGSTLLERFNTLEQLGYLLGREPYHHHAAGPEPEVEPEPEMTTGARLLSALGDYIREAQESER